MIEVLFTTTTLVAVVPPSVTVAPVRNPVPAIATLEPPLIGVSIGKDASCYELLRSAGRFAVSLLGAEQEELARRFAAGYPPIVHWEGVPTREGQAAPLIEGALGWIEAETRAEADAGDHTFFIADVLSIEHGPSHLKPMTMASLAAASVS